MLASIIAEIIIKEEIEDSDGEVFKPNAIPRMGVEPFCLIKY
jgi:hypothetical protein